MSQFLIAGSEAHPRLFHFSETDLGEEIKEKLGRSFFFDIS